ncbi:Transposon TX1 uncharacterized 149 kDa protein [Vitis vinifera]|uniref:Transposon TX1 uncharacterized 149 kDa protein n=1 Tax=Vitis vinifera TaxID=29760 RepID=A0A438HTV4_VITVI|nr:Transposon TX1 uncharacterized 149 kDa protein [Vitis vinifera]
MNFLKRLIKFKSESASRLDSSFTEEEISKAIFQLDRDKTLGPDDFTIAVFQDFWDVINEDLVRVFAEFHRSGIINQSTNASFIVLLPKKSLTKKISNFRPISLITSLYKIIAKVLSRHLRGVLHETIHSTQGSFVQGRQILDAVLIVNEIVDEKRQSGEEGVVFKIDFEKAYDHVSWDFLDHVLEKKGFSPKWRKWMSGCLSTVSYAVLVNGNAKGWVKASRGLRQGDPLSHFLFTLVADVLSRMLLRAGERNLLECFRVGNPKACGFWDPVIERISRRLDGWQKAYLSFGVRITFIQSCLTHMPCYFLSLFKIPVSVAAKIERGIGIGKISLKNLALLRKWLWRYLREGSALWHQGILSIYGSHSNTIVRWSHRCPWKAIAQVFQEFSKFTQFVFYWYKNVVLPVVVYSKGKFSGKVLESSLGFYILFQKPNVCGIMLGTTVFTVLIQSKTDGKLVELNAHCAHADHGCGSCDCSDDAGISEALLNSRVEAIVNEYSDLLTTQLENQKLYFESLLREVKEETEREISEAVEKAVTLKLQKLQAKLDKCVKEKKFLDDLNENLLQNQEIWEAKIKEIEERERKVLKLKDDKIQELEEQERQEQLPAINEIKDEPKMVEQLHLQTSNEAPSWQYQESRLQEVA